MSTSTTNQHEIVHENRPYVQAFLALGVLTIIEIGVGTLASTIPVLIVLGLLAFAKGGIVVAVFMHVAYEKDTKNIIFFCFVLPVIAVLILSATITLDYRNF